MKKRTFQMMIITLIVGVIMAQSIAFADTTITKIKSSDGVIIVSGEWDSGEALTYEVYKKEVTNPKFSDIAGFGEIPFSFDNTFSFEFGLKETGVYKICISDGYDVIYEEVVYASEEDRTAFMTGVAEILSNSETAPGLIGDMLEAEENRAVIMTIGIDFDKYALYTEEVKTAICKKVAELGGNQSLSETEFVEIYNEAEALAVINAGETALGEEMMETLNFSFENVRYGNIKDNAKKTWICQAMLKNVPYGSLMDMEKMYNKVSALYVINTAKISNIKSKIESYAEILEIKDTEEYIKYKKSATAKVNTNLIEDISESKPYSVELFLKALKKAATTESSGGGGGSSGGGGGGGSSSGGGASSKNNFAIEETPKNEVEETETVETAKFTDVPMTHWAYDAICEMQERGVVSGVGNGMFLPDKAVTREEFVKMIITAFKLEDENAKSHFHDVFESDWFYPYLSAAFEKGIVTGDDLGIFGVHSGITRQDAALISSRAMKVAGTTATGIREYESFADEAAISDYARDAVKELYCAGKINGTDTGFAPMRSCTRAEAVMMIYGILR
ncbi:MAG: S-layer homology domain-containing protein [Ruminococcaceae bacterium]|nr:S-layer homology domain-containing protein [Oscillospiraceae bacterium]